jgi:hypothetical protein
MVEAREQAKGWTAFLVDLPDDPDDEPEVVIFCPPCAANELGYVRWPHNGSTFPS